MFDLVFFTAGQNPLGAWGGWYLSLAKALVAESPAVVSPED